MKKISLFIKGMIVGIANIIPGVSGGTMAVVTNVYDLMVDVLSFKIENLKTSLLHSISTSKYKSNRMDCIAYAKGYLCHDFDALPFEVLEYINDLCFEKNMIAP